MSNGILGKPLSILGFSLFDLFSKQKDNSKTTTTEIGRNVVDMSGNMSKALVAANSNMSNDWATTGDKMQIDYTQTTSANISSTGKFTANSTSSMGLISSNAASNFNNIQTNWGTTLNASFKNTVSFVNATIAEFDRIPKQVETVHVTREITVYGNETAPTGGISGSSTKSGVFSPITSFVSGLFGGISKIFGFQEGGIVPGPIGAPLPAIVHGGEIITPSKNQVPSINLYVSYSINVSDKAIMEKMIKDNNTKLVTDLRRIIET
jgi:hypothetical protein